MFNKEENPINKDWKEYYDVLEGIRRTGVCNMFSSSVYLKEFCPELSEQEAKKILCSWMTNYEELRSTYGW